MPSDALCCSVYHFSYSVHSLSHPAALSLFFSLLSEALVCLSHEKSSATCVYGCLPRLFQGWYQWNKGLLIFFCCLYDHSNCCTPVIDICLCILH